MSETPRVDHYRAEFRHRKETSDLIEWILDEFSQVERDLRAAQERLAQLTAPGEYGELPRQLRELAGRISDNLPLMSIPVNQERDGDVLADKAATAIEQLQASRIEAEASAMKQAVRAEQAEVMAEAVLEHRIKETMRANEAEARLAELRYWLDHNTTFYDTSHYDKPVLASVSKRIWYHATNDQESYPFSDVADAARRKEGA